MLSPRCPALLLEAWCFFVVGLVFINFSTGWWIGTFCPG
jgi:hypothetical protein